MDRKPVPTRKTNQTSVTVRKNVPKQVAVRKEVTSKKIVTRSKIALAVLFCFMLGLVARFAVLQLVDPDHYADAAAAQYTYDVKLEAKRGIIYANDGTTKLAVSATTQTVFISPADVLEAAGEAENGKKPRGEAGQIRFLAEGLAECLDGYEAQTLIDKYNKLGDKKKAYRYLVVKKDISEAEEAKVRAFISENDLELQIALEEGTKRYYPNGTFASQVLGFVGTDNIGLTGIESAYDEYLRGTDGRATRAQDANGNELAYNYELYVPAEDGNNVVLTIDPTIQTIVNKYIKQTYEEHEPEGRVSCVVMDVDTGEILALGLYPTFDLNDFSTLSAEYQKKYDDYLQSAEEKTDEDTAKYRNTLLNEMWNDTVATQTYEPGSTFKLITAAAALETKSITTDQTFYCGRVITLPGDTSIHCWSTVNHGDQTLEQALVASCNPAFVRIGQAIGKTDFLRYFEEFGYTKRTGSDLPGETTSIYYATTGTDFNDVSLATYSFGQTFKVTMLQHIAGVSTIANGGYLVTPHIVKQITDQNGNVVKTMSTEPVRQVVASSVCETLLKYLTNSTKNACVSGYNVVSKTGTSEKRDTKRDNDYVSSCVTFAPAEDPKIAILVTVDTPDTALGYYGSAVAAPAVGRILSEVLPYIGIEPGESGKVTTVSVGSYVGSALRDAKAAVEALGLSVIVKGDGNVVLNQLPAAGTTVTEGGTVILYTEENMDLQTTSMPNVIGSGVEAAKRALLAKGLNVRLSGVFGDDTAGCQVVSASYQKGDDIPVGTVVVLECRYQSVND